MTIVTLRTEKLGDRSQRERRALIQAIEWQVRAVSSVWEPPCDIFETEAAYIVRVEVAGMRDQEISVTLDGNLLVIHGTRSELQGRRAYHQMEIRFGDFTVAASLPGPVDDGSAAAAYEDGFLLVTLPKA
jgi:HSP20 family protein